MCKAVLAASRSCVKGSWVRVLGCTVLRYSWCVMYGCVLINSLIVPPQTRCLHHDLNGCLMLTLEMVLKLFWKQTGYGNSSGLYEPNNFIFLFPLTRIVNIFETRQQHWPLTHNPQPIILWRPGQRQHGVRNTPIYCFVALVTPTTWSLKNWTCPLVETPGLGWDCLAPLNWANFWLGKSSKRGSASVLVLCFCFMEYTNLFEGLQRLDSQTSSGASVPECWGFVKIWTNVFAIWFAFQIA